MDGDALTKFLHDNFGDLSPIIISLLLAISVALPIYNAALKLIEAAGWFSEGGLMTFFQRPSALRVFVFHLPPFIIFFLLKASGLNIDYARTFIFFHFLLVCIVIVVVYGARAWHAAMQPWPLQHESDFLSLGIWDIWAIAGIWTAIVNIYARPWPMHGWLDDFNTAITLYSSYVGIVFIELAWRFYSGSSFQQSLAVSIVLWVCAAVFSGTFVVIAGPVIR